MNEKNLISIAERTTSEQREIARAGGLASGAARRENKKTRPLVRMALESIDEQTGLTLKEKAVLSLVKAAAEGDLRAFEIVTKLVGDWNDGYTASNAWITCPEDE